VIKKCWFDADGNLINIGEWDTMPEQVEVSPEQRDEEGNLIAESVYETVERNPIPPGAFCEEREVIQTEDGGWHLAGYAPPESPSQKINNLENENALLALELAQTQLRLDQAEQERAALLLTLVQEGVI
jgi:hypothetical protein